MESYEKSFGNAPSDEKAPSKAQKSSFRMTDSTALVVYNDGGRIGAANSSDEKNWCRFGRLETQAVMSEIQRIVLQLCNKFISSDNYEPDSYKLGREIDR